MDHGCVNYIKGDKKSSRMRCAAMHRTHRTAPRTPSAYARMLLTPLYLVVSPPSLFPTSYPLLDPRCAMGDSPLLSKGRYRKCHCNDCINFCILALGSGQRLLYRLGSGLGLVLVLVLLFCMCPADLCDSGPESCHARPLGLYV